MARASFAENLRANAAALTAGTAFFGSVAGFLNPFGGGATVAALVVASVAVVSYNVWRWRRARPLPGFGELPGPKRRRLALHVASGLGLAVLWSAAGVVLYPPTNIRLRLALSGCEGARSALDAYVAGDGARDAALRSLQIDCTADPRTQERLVRALLDDRAVWRGDDPAQSAARGLLRLRLVMSPFLKEGELAAEARELGKELPDNPVVLPLLAFATAIGSKGDERVRGDIERLLLRAEEAGAGSSPALRRRLSVFRLYWGGRAFQRADLLADAERLFREGLADIAAAPELSDLYWLQLGQVQFRQDRTSGAAERSWAAMRRPDARSFSVRAVDAAYRSQHAETPAQAAAFRAEADRLAEQAGRSPGAADDAVRFQVATVHFTLGRYAESLVTLQALAQEFPNRKQYAVWAGRAAFSSKDFKLARSLLEKDADDPDASFWLGRTHYALGDFEAARRALRQAETQDPGAPRPMLWLAIVSAAQSEGGATPAARIAANESALADLARAEAAAAAKPGAVSQGEIDGIRTLVLNSLAYAYADDPARLALARDYAERALVLRPDDAGTLDTLGYIGLREVQSGAAKRDRAARLEAAGVLLTRALAGLPATDTKARAETLVHLGLLAELRGDPAGARRQYRAALALDAGNAAALRGLGPRR